MRETIFNVRKVWDNGVGSPFPALKLEDIDELKRRTGATRVLAFRWQYRGEERETSHQISVLPDKSGLVQCDGFDADGPRLIVLNGDGTQRLVIGVPSVDVHSCPEKGYLALPPSSAQFGGIEWGCEGNDGHTDYLFDFDWNTGKLLRYARPTRPW
jgi:hypothetical protein